MIALLSEEESDLLEGYTVIAMIAHPSEEERELLMVCILL